jgi:hypothetical protein
LRKQGSLGSTAESVAEKVFAVFLTSDIYDTSQLSGSPHQGLLPANLTSKHKENLAPTRALVLQIDEITNVGASLDQQKQESNRYLKLFLTDGVNSVVALEHRRVEELRRDIPAGTKVSLKNVPIRRGALMLSPSCFKVLGGEVSRLSDLAQLYAPPEEEQQPGVMEQRPPQPPANNPVRPPVQQQFRPPAQQAPQRQPPRQQQPDPIPVPAAAPEAAEPEPAQRGPPSPEFYEPDQYLDHEDTFPYSATVDLLNSPHSQQQSPGGGAGAGREQATTPLVYDLTNSGPNTSQKDTEEVKSEMKDIASDGSAPVEHPVAMAGEEDDLLRTPPGPAGSGPGAVVAVRNDEEEKSSHRVSPPVVCFTELSSSSSGSTGNGGETLIVRGHTAGLHKFKIKKPKASKGGNKSQDSSKSQSPASKTSQQGQGQPTTEFDVFVIFDDGSGEHKTLRVHPLLCEQFLQISAQSYQDQVDALDEKAAGELKREVQLKFTTFAGIFRCEWAKKQKKKAEMELCIMEELKDTDTVKAVAAGNIVSLLKA